MKKSNIGILIVFFILVPLTLFFGMHLSGRAYYLIGTLIVIEILIPFFLAFEGRRPQAREMAVIAVMCALSVAARAIPIPNFKPMFAIIMLSGVAFGPEAGFLVGAVGAFASNFLYGQGPYTPWQMTAYGAGGLLAGFVFQSGKVTRKPLALAVFGFFATMLVVGPLLDTCSVFLMLSKITWPGALAIYASGLPVNFSQAVCTVLTMLLFGRPLLEKLDRIKLKYGMMEGEDGL